MAFAGVTDKQLAALRATPKHVISAPSKASKPGHSQEGYRLLGADGSLFRVYLRQSSEMTDNFSAGIVWMASEGELHLARFNGSSHVHHNQLEGSTVATFHVHRATQKYIESGKQPEGYAEEASYSTLAGALCALVTEFNVSGIETETESGYQLKLLLWEK